MNSTVKTAGLLAALSALLLLLGAAIGGRGGMQIALVFAVVMNFGSYWFSDRLVLRMYRATPCGSDHPLTVTVARLARQAGLPMPRCYVIPTDSPNAFATGRNPEHAAVAATEGLLRMLTQDELEGVLAHELAHVSHRDILLQSIAATIGAAIMMIANMARWGAMFGGYSRDDRDGGHPLILLVTAMVAPLAAMVIQAAISRSREFAADEGGAHICGKPMSLAAALQKISGAVEQVPMDANPATAHMFIVKPFAGEGILNLFSTHPPTEERIARLRALAGR
ncbi:MAG: zinc metalloprotease HtpX [Deltaproteobacteria bacterium]|nr:zinc metalloprotease HtpX [Deltaproteobacteria bacterium]